MHLFVFVSSTYQIAFEAVRGGTESDIAIDDVSVIDVFDNTSPGPTGGRILSSIFRDSLLFLSRQ